jgi:hypothetical protein
VRCHEPAETVSIEERASRWQRLTEDPFGPQRSWKLPLRPATALDFFRFR